MTTLFATDEKVCTKCGELKPLSEFHRMSSCKKDGRYPSCKPCTIAQQRTYREANLEKVRVNGRAAAHRYTLKRKYGMTRGDYDRMLEEQGGGCAICGETNPGCRNPHAKKTRTAFAVDHDHGTGNVRGLLCDDCNQALGRMKDNPSTLVAAAAYLIRAGGESDEGK